MGIPAKDFKSLLKEQSVEESLDLYFFRPFAFILVKWIYRFPITPNQISIFSIFAAAIGGFCFSLGDKTLFWLGGVMYGFARVLDCSDGMIARLKNNGTPIGRIIDGTMDYISATFVFLGLTLGLSKMDFPSPIPIWMLVLTAGIGMAIHSIIIDYFKCQFMALAMGKDISPSSEKIIFTQELARLKKNRAYFFSRVLIQLYLKYLNIQCLLQVNRQNYNAQQYYRANKKLLRLWSFVGSSTYIFMLLLASILYLPELFFYYALVAANIWMTLLLIFQIKTNHKLAHKENSGIHE